MRVWRVIPGRSLRRRAQRQLRAGRGLQGWSAWQQDIAVALRELDWWRPFALALVANAPAVIGLLGDPTPDWVSSAWQVSATLVGLGVALVVFLLQAASAQSLSSQVTSRAVLAHTWIMWPTALALVFIATSGVVERYGSDEGHASPWAVTWLLVAFVLQIASFGLAFARTLQVVSPTGVAHVLRTAFRDAMRRAVRANLLRRAMVADLHQLCDARVSYGGFLSRGQPAVLAGKAGVLADVDRRLPRALDELGLGERVTLTLEPGLQLGNEKPLAKFDGARGRWLEHMIGQGVRIGRASLPPAAVPVFGDAVDVMRRALASGSQTNLRDAVQLVADCLSALPGIYREWGVPYELQYVREYLSRSTEDEILGALIAVSDDVFRGGSQRPEAVILMSDVAYSMVQTGLAEDAGLLLDQGASLWRHQLNVAHTVHDPDLEQRLHERIGNFGRQAVLAQQHGLQDADAPLEGRLAAQPGLRRLFRHQIEVMRFYLDTGQEERFVAAWRYWVEWAQHWQPQYAVDDLELRGTLGSSRHQRQMARELEAARRLLEAKLELEDERAQLMFALGTWALERRQQGKLEESLWLRLLPYLISAASDANAALRLLRWMWTQQELPPLTTWQLEYWSGQPGWQPSDPLLIAARWGAVQLLRGMPSQGEPALDLGPAAAEVGRALLDHIGQIASDRATWEEAAGGQLDARVNVARRAIDEAVKREAQRADQELADAPLDRGRVCAYAQRQRQAYADGDYLRARMLLRGAIEGEEDPAAFPGQGVRQVLPKQPFTSLEGPRAEIDPQYSAKKLVQQQLREAYEHLADCAEQAEGEPADAAVRAIAELRHTGHEPDAVLLPGDVRLQALLSAHPEWEWTSDFLRKHQHRATLASVPVYDPGPRDAVTLVVCDLGAALRRVERRRPGDISPVRVTVENIGPEQAAQLIDHGHTVAGVSSDRASQEAALIRGYVETEIAIDVVWRRPERGKPAARRIELPSVADRGRPPE